LHYVNAASSNYTLWRGEYGYDATGNRLFERLSQRASAASTWGTVSQPAQSGSNHRSRQFEYDTLDRLITSRSGALNTTPTPNTAIGASDAYPSHVRTEGWNYDLLGNLVQGGLEDPRYGEGGSSGFDNFNDPCYDPGPPTIHPPHPGNHIPWDAGGGGRGADWSPQGHFVYRGGLIKGESQLFRTQTIPNSIFREAKYDASGGPTWSKPIYDPCGNLVLDDKYFYEYDAWNRLVSVREKGSLIWQLFNEWGMPRPTFCEDDMVAGPLVKHFTYDGLGRLARTSSPLQAPEGWWFLENETQTGSIVTSFNRSERFIYDGVRRIQEIVTDPILTDSEDGDVASMGGENEQRGGGTIPAPERVHLFLRAQYIWGPGDNGVDELLCQIEPYSAMENHAGSGGPQGRPWFVLTDAQGDVASIATVPTVGDPIASIAGQWTYSPYGEVLTYDRLAEHPEMLFGHKTLAVDRFDSPTLTWSYDEGVPDGTFVESRRLEPGSRLFAYARNRTLDVQRGRWLQIDPNATSLAALCSLNFAGTQSNCQLAVASLSGRLTDGASLSSYVKSNPISGRDPVGLFTFLDSPIAIGTGIGMVTGGGMGYARGGARGILAGAVTGALLGATGGWIYGATVPAFGASMAGFISAFGTSTIYNVASGNYSTDAQAQEAYRNDLFAGALGSAAAIGPKSVPWQADDVILAEAMADDIPLGF